MSLKTKLLGAAGRFVPEDIRAEAREAMQLCARLGLVEMDGTRLRFTPEGRRALRALETLREMTDA